MTATTSYFASRFYHHKTDYREIINLFGFWWGKRPVEFQNAFTYDIKGLDNHTDIFLLPKNEETVTYVISDNEIVIRGFDPAPYQDLARDTFVWLAQKFDRDFTPFNHYFSDV